MQATVEITFSEGAAARNTMDGLAPEPGGNFPERPIRRLRPGVERP
jgi:hypothetical protein